MPKRSRLKKNGSKARAKRLKNVGTIMAVYDRGTIWQMEVKKPDGKTIMISGDWRPMRDSLDEAFDIRSPEFPYVSSEKMYENVIGQKIKFTPDPTFGASSWSPLGKKEFDLRVTPKGRIKKVK